MPYYRSQAKSNAEVQPAMTKHKQDCKMAFGKKDSTCPRCIELINGAEPRGGWQKDYFAKQKFNENRESKNCCGGYRDFGICTCGT